MSDFSNSLRKEISIQKQINKRTIIEWISGIIREIDQKFQIEDLHSGEIYCKVINHFAPNTIPPNRIINSPHTPYDFCLNLKLFQKALLTLKIDLPFDIEKVHKPQFSSNWLLITQLYKILAEQSFSVTNHHEKERANLNQNSAIKMDKNKEQNSERSQKISFSRLESCVEEKRNVCLAQGEPRWSIDRIKQIVISGMNNAQKVRQVKILLGIQEIKIEEEY